MNGAIDGVGSAEWIEVSTPVVDATVAGARELGRRYWSELRRSTRGLVRIRAEDGRVELVAAGALTLFRFGAAELRADPGQVECRYPIVGGLLVARPGGWLAVVQRAAPPQLGLVVAGYRPRLASSSRRSVRRLAYTRIQARLHLVVSRRALERIAGGGA